ncbi:MAG: sulfatase-like hydrolase/transferase [Lentisphaerae bacterium]|nr:sulfatase-like hydrolase/transferase [Lentisphaerota bacterium]
MTPRPNIVIITADQLSQRAVGAYGDPQNVTPHIDALAQSGATFANAYSPCPLCMPARAAFWTSQFPHRTGIHTNSNVLRIPADMPTLGSVFTQAGYRCAHFGKTHDCGGLLGFEVVHNSGAPVEETPPWTNYYDSQEDRATTAQAIDFLKVHGDQPYVMAVELNNPHDVCLWIGDHVGQHADTPVPGRLPALPENFEDADLATRPSAIRYNCCTNFRVAQTLAWTPENFRHYLAAYYHYVAMLDHDVGRVLNALALRPDAANTIIVFTADHGDGMTSHRMVTKGGHFYEETTRVPLVIAGPGIPRQRSLTRAPLVSLLDVFPTLCAGADIPAPEGLAGRSLALWLRGHGPRDERTHVTSSWFGHAPALAPARMVRSHRFKYTHFREDGAEELYDLVKDPGERRNLAADPAQTRTLADHRALLQQHCAATGDPFFAETVTVTPPAHAHPPGSCPFHPSPAHP